MLSTVNDITPRKTIQQFYNNKFEKQKTIKMKLGLWIVA